MNKLDSYFYALMTRTVFILKIYKICTCIESVYKRLHFVIFTRLLTTKTTTVSLCTRIVL